MSSPPILSVAETGSTNADLLELAAGGGARDGMWLVADRQTDGRGRQGRAWQSPPGNLYASALVRLRTGDPPAPTLALVAGVALATSLHRLGIADAQIKWPNDMLRAGAKVAGILLERGGDWVVIGIGVNLATAPDVPGRATARVEGVTRDELLDALRHDVAHWCDGWRREGLAVIVARWRLLAHPPGTPLRVALPDGEALHGTFDDLDESGALRVRLADGSARAIHAGDVFLI